VPNGKGNESSERRARPAPPSSYDTAKRWPDASFRDVEDEAIREACLIAQDIARAVRQGIGTRSVTELAAQSGVDRKLLHKLMDGETWPAIYTVARLFHLLEREIVVPERPNPRTAG
jgi:DNA-binding phage protein